MLLHYTPPFITYVWQVFWKRLYSSSSMVDGGTLYQLRNLIQHRNVANHPKNSFTACEDFLVLVAEAHVVAAALKILDVFCGGFSLP